MEYFLKKICQNIFLLEWTYPLESILQRGIPLATIVEVRRLLMFETVATNNVEVYARQTKK